MPRSARLEKGDCWLLGAGAPSASARPSLPSWDAQGRAESLARTPAAAVTPQSLRRPHSPDAATAAAGGAVSTPLAGAECPQAPRAERRGRRVQAVGAAAAPPPPTGEAAKDSQYHWKRPGRGSGAGFLRTAPPLSRPARRGLAHWPRGILRARTCGAHLGCSKGPSRSPAGGARDSRRKER